MDDNNLERRVIKRKASCSPLLFGFFVLALVISQEIVSAENDKKMPKIHTTPRDRHLASGHESLTEALKCTSLGDVIEANNGRFPRSIREWVEALDRFGVVVPTYVPFSRSPNSSSLTRPRILLTVQNRWEAGPKKSANSSNIMDHVFISISLNPDGTQTLEFITSRQKPPGYQFGVMENFKNVSAASFRGHASASANCFTCHRNQSPIFPEAPWSDTDQHLATRVAMLEAFHSEQPMTYATAFKEIAKIREQANGDQARFRTLFRENKILNEQELVFGEEATGLKLFGSDPGSFDSRVRAASEYHFLMQAVAAGDERGGLLLKEGVKKFTSDMLDSSGPFGLVAQPFNQNYHNALGSYSKSDLSSMPTLGSSFLKEFNPVKGQGDPNGDSDGPNPLDSNEITRIIEFNKLSQEERKKRHQQSTTPTSAEGFTDTFATSDFSNKNSIHVADGLRFLLRITDSDLAELERLRKQVPKELWNEIKKEALANPLWESLYQKKQLPDRHTYLQALAATLNAALEKRKIQARYNAPDKPTGANSCEEEPGQLMSVASALDSVATQTSNCISCHDKGSSSTAFPFDPENREMWKTWWNDPKRRASAENIRRKVIERLQSSKRPMPPSDSEEAARFTKSEKQALIDFLNGLK